jgi:predicted ATPase/DNA-binding XRE family transcriptional regulator
MEAVSRGNGQTFGEMLRQRRVAAGLTQEELAERAGLSRRGISDLERGARTHPYRETLSLLADALGLQGAERRAFFAAVARRSTSEPAVSRGSATPLPIPPNPLVGRAEELQQGTEFLRDPSVRLLTLTGVGGSGKTRLAIETARQLPPDFPDGVLFVDLAPLTDPDLVAGAIATALRVREQPGEQLLHTLGSTLARRRLLLILDNFEHLLPAATVVNAILAAAPRVKVLVTSRTRLALAAEQELPVLPLTVPGPATLPSWEQVGGSDAVRLFVMRARALQPDFALTAANAPVVAEICRRLDGLPLALELAAARVKVLPPEAMLARLERRLPLLTSGARDLPTRQRTLRDTIAWSYDLLSPKEQVLFQRLAVFVGGWTLAAAEAVTNPDGTLDVLAGIGALVDWSLVRQSDKVDEEPRFTMLETIREYALEQLGQRPDEAEAIQRAHAAYFAELSLALWPEISAGVPAAMRCMRAEEDNLRAMLETLLNSGDTETALRVAGSSLSVYWAAAGGQFSAARAWLEGTLREGAAASAAARVLAYQGLSLIALFQGDFRTSRAAATAARELAGVADDPTAVGRGAFALSLVAEAEGQMEAAGRFALEAVAAARVMEWPGALGWSLVILGGARAHAGDLPGATLALEEALTLFRGLGGAWGEANTLFYLAGVARTEGDLTRAARLHAEALAVRRDAGLLTEAFDDLVGIAEIAQRLGSLAPAARLLGAEDAYHAVFGSVGWGVTATRREHTRQALIAQLGDESFQRAWNEGRALSTEEVITEALLLAAELADASC